MKQRGRKVGQTLTKWSHEEEAWLKENYTKGIDYCVKQLGRPYGGVTTKLYMLRLSSTGRQLKELVPYVHVYVKPEPKSSKLPVFHPVMLGLYPSREHGSNRMWKKRRAIILKMHDNLCVYCGDEADTVDHVIPINKGGTDHPENLVAACLKCNSAFCDKTKHVEMRIA
jgi:hypothetical protein